MVEQKRIRPPKASKLAKTRRAFQMARRMGAKVKRTIANGYHVYHLTLPANLVWVRSGNRELWIGGASYGSRSGCADIDIALSKIEAGVKDGK